MSKKNIHDKEVSGLILNINKILGDHPDSLRVESIINLKSRISNFKRGAETLEKLKGIKVYDNNMKQIISIAEENLREYSS